MNTLNALYHPFMQALGFAVLHSLWQGLLLFCLLKAALAFVPQKRATARYRLTYCSLAGLFFLFVYTLGMEWQQATGTMQAAASATGIAHQEQGWNNVLFLRAAVWCRDYAPALAWIYAGGVLLFTAKMVMELVQLQKLRREATIPHGILEQQFARLKSVAGVTGNVLLRLSSRINVPVMLGHLKPLVLLPASLATRLDVQQLEALLLHELAHIRRHDYLWNMLQLVMDILLFFNPVAWWLSAVVREEREHCCDDFVVRHTASLPYAHALLALEEHRQSLARPLVAANGNRSSSLFNRIKRITAMKSEKNNSQRTLAAVAALVLIVAMACFATAFGQDKKEKTKTANHSYGKSVIVVQDKDGNTQKYEKEYGDQQAVGGGMSMDMTDRVLDKMDLAMDMTDKVLDNIDWDNMSKVVEGSMAMADKAMQQIDWKEIHSNVDKAMKEVDWNKIQDDVDKAMKKADISAKAAMDQREVKETVRKAMDEARNALQAVDWQSISKEVNTELAQAMKEVREEMNNMDWQTEMKQSMAEAREEMKRARKDMEQNMERDMQQAKEDLKRAKEDMKRAKEDMKRSKEEMKRSFKENEEDAENGVIR